jgi:hypothetical protein
VKRALWTLLVLLSHWRRHPMQLATLLIGLISATALWSGVQALNQQARTSYDRAAATFGGARTAMLVARSGASFPQKLFVDLRRAGWPVSPVLEGRIQIEGRSFRLLGIEPVTLPAEVGNAPPHVWRMTCSSLPYASHLLMAQSPPQAPCRGESRQSASTAYRNSPASLAGVLSPQTTSLQGLQLA